MTYQVAIDRGHMDGRLSSQWFSRPGDERFASLSALHAATETWRRDSEEHSIDTRSFKIEGSIDEEKFRSGEDTRGDLFLETKDGEQFAPTNWAFSQLAQRAGAPAGYLATLPGPIASDALNWGLRYERSVDSVKLLSTIPGVNRATRRGLRAVTGPDYGRIWHEEIVRVVLELNRRHDNRWKIPGMIDWGSRADNGTFTYDPEAKGDTTLFASDRDMYGFLCDDRNPIEIGKLPDGSPDLVFRGFCFWNSEEGSKTAGLIAFIMRGICQNRCFWGVENMEEFRIRHTKFAPDRFASEAAPALESFCEGSTQTLLEGVALAKEAQAATDREEALDFLTTRAGLSRKMSNLAFDRHVSEEDKEPRSIWDMSQAITAIARDIPQQDNRVALEMKAGALLDKVA
tara:strand:+ start:106 stop:1308 length:1203 start_codon:yes stop_codon:yes gene_type:complete